MEFLANLDGANIITIILGAIATFGGAFWIKSKGKLKDIAALAFDVFELLSEVERALTDDKISKEEIENIKIRIADVKAAFKKLVNKK